MEYNFNERLQELATMPFTENLNYIRVIRSIPTYFDTSDIYMCMMFAFNFGNARGRECEQEKIKWNSLACFHNMHAYANAHDGKLPKTQEDLKTWVDSHD